MICKQEKHLNCLISLELIAVIREIGIQLIAELCHRILSGLGIPTEWALCILVSIFKCRGDIRNCSCYRAMKLLEHGMKVVEREFE